MGKYPLRTQQEDALYTPAVRALYRGNPWIEALPDSLTDQELFRALQGKIPYDENERTLDHYQREACIQSLTHVFVPLGATGEIARKIDAAIREGYVSRNPLVSGWNREMGRLQECVRDHDADFSHLSGGNANACGFCLVGDSGMGKTSAVNHTLALYPQVLFHSSYNGTAFPCAQIVWMRLECPQDASVKGLCSEFFMEFDRITGENTFQKFAASGRATTDQMIPQMAMLAQRHGLGLLVIDEIQNLSAAKSGGAQRMLNFIVQLVNKIGLPVLLVGTPPAIGLLSADQSEESGASEAPTAHPGAIFQLPWGGRHTSGRTAPPPPGDLPPAFHRRRNSGHKVQGRFALRKFPWAILLFQDLSRSTFSHNVRHTSR